MHGELMQLMDAIYAATLNPNLPSGQRYKPHDSQFFMPADYCKDKPQRESIVEQLDRFTGRK